MKNIFKLSGVILLIFLVHACKKDKPTPPVLTTSAVTEISYTTATSGGNATSEGGAPIVTKGVCWNTSADPTIANSKTIESSGLGVFTSNLTQLTPNTLYYVRAYATNSAGTGYGNQVTFTTLTVEVPVLTTSEITDITKTTAFSGGNISDDKGGSITAKGVCWGVATNPTTANNKTADGTGTGSFISNISNLEPETVYYVRAYATNSAGTAYGTEVVFKTLDNYILYSTTQVGGGSSIPNTLILIDPWNGRGIITGSIGKAKEQFSMDVDPITGSLFGVNPNLPGVIEKIDVKNGESSSIFTISQSDVPLHIWGIAFSPDGILYGVLENRILGIIDLNKGTFSSIQQIGSEGIISGIDFSPQGTLYAIKETYNPDVQFLITIDEKTAIITSSRILLESYTVGDIDYSSDGFIYGTNFSWALLRIDPITLHITIVGFNDLGALGGIASIPQ